VTCHPDTEFKVALLVGTRGGAVHATRVERVQARRRGGLAVRRHGAARAGGRVRVRGAPGGRGFHSFTFQLNLSRV